MTVQGRVMAAVSGLGLAGVAASNGETVTATGADGAFCLPADSAAGGFVWICTPTGWRARGDAYFQRLSPGRDPGAEVVFELVEAPERRRRNFRLAQVSDLHVVVDGDGLTPPAVLRQCLQDLEAESAPDLIVASGDLTNRGSRAELRALCQALAAASAPVFPLFAGHDGNEERHQAAAPGGTFTRNWEAEVGPTYYSFDWGGRHFVLCPMEEGFYSAADRARKRAWLEADLAHQPPGREIVVVLHTPPDAALLEQLGRRGASLLLHGHWHSSRSFRHAGVAVHGLPCLCFGGIDTWPRAYRTVEFTDGGGRTTSLKVLGLARLRPETPEIDGFERVWEVRVPGGCHRAPAVATGDGRLLLSLLDEDLQGHAGVACLDAETGQARWHAPAAAAVKNRVAVDAASGRAVALAATGRLSAVDLQTGRVAWEANLPGYPERWLYTTPDTADGVVYAGGKAGYGAWTMDAGARVWYTPLESSDNWSCFAGARVAGDLLVILVQRRGLVALDRRSGAVRWECPLEVDYQWADPVVADGALISGGGSGELVGVGTADGQVQWRQGLGAPYPSGLAADEHRVYVSTPTGQVQGRERGDGSLAWTRATGPDLLDLTPYRRGIASILAAPVPLGDLVAAGANDGCLYLLEAATGQPRARAPFGAPLSAPVTRLADGFCAATLDGRLVRYRRTGRPSAAGGALAAQAGRLGVAGDLG
ncbi:MAG: PQQ-binding-like beta-propeller repeat protein [Gemmatimonadota bacterium]